MSRGGITWVCRGCGRLHDDGGESDRARTCPDCRQAEDLARPGTGVRVGRVQPPMNADERRSSPGPVSVDTSAAHHGRPGVTIEERRALLEGL